MRFGIFADLIYIYIFFLPYDSHPMASVEKTKQVFDSLAPYVVSFSSRGPHPFTPSLLKVITFLPHQTN